MKIIIQSPHSKPTEELTSFVKNKLNGLSHFYERIEYANVFLKIEKSDTEADKVCEIKLGIPGNDLFATKQSDSFENAVTLATDALQEQIEKMKNKIEAHQ